MTTGKCNPGTITTEIITAEILPGITEMIAPEERTRRERNQKSWNYHGQPTMGYQVGAKAIIAKKAPVLLAGLKSYSADNLYVSNYKKHLIWGAFFVFIRFSDYNIITNKKRILWR